MEQVSFDPRAQKFGPMAIVNKNSPVSICRYSLQFLIKKLFGSNWTSIGIFGPLDLIKRFQSAKSHAADV